MRFLIILILLFSTSVSLAENKDFTFVPYIFEKNLQMFQNEYRQITEKSKIYANFGFVNNFKSTL